MMSSTSRRARSSWPTPARRAAATTSSSSSLPWLIACRPIARFVRARRSRVVAVGRHGRAGRGPRSARRAWWIASRWRARRTASALARRQATAASNGRPAASRCDASRSGGAPRLDIAAATVEWQRGTIGVQQGLVGRLGDQLAGEPVAAVLVAQHAGAHHRLDVAGRPADVAAEHEVDLGGVERRARARRGAGRRCAPVRAGRAPTSTSRTATSARRSADPSSAASTASRDDLDVQRHTAGPVGDLVERLEAQPPGPGERRGDLRATRRGRADRGRSGRSTSPPSSTGSGARVVSTTRPLARWSGRASRRSSVDGSAASTSSTTSSGSPPPQRRCRAASTARVVGSSPPSNSSGSTGRSGCNGVRVVAAVAAQPHGVGAAIPREPLDERRLADARRSADDDRHELRRRPRAPASASSSRRGRRDRRDPRPPARRDPPPAIGARRPPRRAAGQGGHRRRRRRRPSPSPRRAGPGRRRPRSRSRVAARSGSPAMPSSTPSSTASITTTPVSTPTRTATLPVGDVTDRRAPPARRARRRDRPTGTRSTPTARRRRRSRITPPRSTMPARAARRTGATSASSSSGSRASSAVDDDLHGHDRDPAALALDDGPSPARRRRRQRRGAGCVPRARGSAGPGSRPSSAPSRRRSVRNVASASAWRPTRYCAVMSWPANPSCSGFASTVCSQLGQDLTRPQPHLALEQLVQRGQAALVELHRVRHAARRSRAGRRTRRRATDRGRCAGWRPRARRRRSATVARSLGLEGVGVDRHERRIEAVAAGLAADGVGLVAERPPQPGDVDLHRLAGPCLRTIRPQAVDQLVDADDAAAATGQQGRARGAAWARRGPPGRRRRSAPTARGLPVALRSTVLPGVGRDVTR